MGKNNNGAVALTLVEKAEQELQEAVATPAVELVSVSLRKGFPKRVVNLIASVNNAEVDETEEFYVIKAPYIKVTRSDLESVAGKVTDARWRMLFVNRSGEVKDFNNYEFSIGAPKPVIVEETPKEQPVQLNIRISPALKEEIEELRKLLGDNYSQNSFVEDAIKEFVTNIRKEMA